MKVFKKILSTLLVAIMLLSITPMSTFAEENTAYKTGDIVEFGSYPQSEVRNKEIISQLNAVIKNWISYGYYSGTGKLHDGQMVPSDYMKYADITLNGNKYRAVTFSKYRKWYTDYTADTSTGYTYQDGNGYYINNVYYFKYEPLKWRVLDTNTGLIVCDNAIDSQAYNNYTLLSGWDYYGDSAKTYFANNWEHSSLRAWLNNDFLNTAFTSSQQSKIQKLTRENKSSYSSIYDSNPTSDKITLLSYEDALNTNYGFSSLSSPDAERQRKSTDYARCQGCCGNYANYYTTWWLRSSQYSDQSDCVDDDGWVDGPSSSHFSVNLTLNGIVPALNVNNLSNLNSSNVVFDTEAESSQVSANIGDTSTIEIITSGDVTKARLTDESGNTITNPNYIENLDGTRSWQFSRTATRECEYNYKVSFKINGKWSDTDKTVTFTFAAVQNFGVESVSLNGVLNGSFNRYSVKVNGIATKLQVIFPNGGTYTFDRNGTKITNNNSRGIVSINAYNKDKNEVPFGSSDTEYEIWVLNMALKDGTYTIKAKQSNTWETAGKTININKYATTVDEVKVVKVTGKNGAYSFKLNGSAQKLQVISSKGATNTFSKSSLNVSVKYYNAQDVEVAENSNDVTYEIWTINKNFSSGKYYVITKYHNNTTYVWGETRFTLNV